MMKIILQLANKSSEFVLQSVESCSISYFSSNTLDSKSLYFLILYSKSLSSDVAKLGGLRDD
jgi:hypothetical protein